MPVTVGPLPVASRRVIAARTARGNAAPGEKDVCDCSGSACTGSATGPVPHCGSAHNRSLTSRTPSPPVPVELQLGSPLLVPGTSTARSWKARSQWRRGKSSIARPRTTGRHPLSGWYASALAHAGVLVASPFHFVVGLVGFKAARQCGAAVCLSTKLPVPVELVPLAPQVRESPVCKCAVVLLVLVVTHCRPIVAVLIVPNSLVCWWIGHRHPYKGALGLRHCWVLCPPPGVSFPSAALQFEVRRHAIVLPPGFPLGFPPGFTERAICILKLGTVAAAPCAVPERRPCALCRRHGS